MHDMFWGMHMFWWIFWIILIVLLVVLLNQVPRDKTKQTRKTPLEVLEQRYAAGEITTEEYKERKAVLEAESTKSP